MKRHKTDINPAVSLEEITRFNQLAAEWWDPQGAMGPLHRMNPVRLRYIADTLSNHFKSLKSIKLLDVGCGGGLVAEPLARLGAKVTGIDGATDLVGIAQSHAASQNLSVTYRTALTSDLIAEKQLFDAVLALEVIEHIPNQTQFVQELARLVKPGGLIILSTLNRTPSSFAFGVVAAEYVLRWLPRGTHDWKKFVKPSELHMFCTEAGLQPQETTGLVYHPSTDEFALDAQNLKINYFLTATKA